MSAKEQFDPAILATLTDEERAAIVGDDGDHNDLAALQKLADETSKIDGAVPDDDGEDDDGDDDAGDIAAAPAKDAVEPVKVDEPAPALTAEPPAPEQKVVYDYKLPEDYSEKVAAIREREDDLAKQFKDGDLDFDEYRAATRELDAERESLADMRIKAAISEDLSHQTSESAWTNALINFNSNVAKVDGIDYAKDVEKQEDFDLFLKTLGDKPENAEKDMNWFITEAHKRVKALHGIVGKPEVPTPPKNRKAPIDMIPQTLVDVPGGDGPGDVSDEFSSIDRLEGLAFEDALAALKRNNPAAFARYEAR